MTDKKLFEHLEEEIVSYVEQSESEDQTIDVSDQDEGVRNMPVEMVGERRLALDEIDFAKRLGPKQYEFAIDYAFGGAKTLKQMAEEHGVTQITVGKWIRKPEVQGLIAYVRSEHRAMALAQWLRLERKAFKAMERVLDKKISSGNIDAIGRNSWNIIKEGLYLRGASGHEEDPDNAQSGVNVNVNVAGDGRPGTGPRGGTWNSGGTDKKDLSNEDIEDINRQIKELEELDQALEGTYEEVEDTDEQSE